MKDDPILIKRTLDGDMQAFRWLVTKHQGLVTHIVRRIVRNDEETEEICQDVFIKVYNNLSGFKGDSKFTTWLVTIAYRTSLNHVTKKKISTDSLDDVKHALTDSQLPSRQLEKKELSELLEKAISQLPDQYRKVITLFHLEDMSYETVSDITGMPVGTVKNYLFRGRKMLKELLVTFKYSELQ